MSSEDQRSIFLERADVSRETASRFDAFAGLLSKWNPSINLVAPGTIADRWSRHFMDSLSVWEATEIRSGKWVDLGSGGGFPGLIVAMLAAEKATDLKVSCVEVDMRKATFLRTVSRETSIDVSIHTKRVEMLPPLGANVLSARALTSLEGLLAHAERHLAPDGEALFSKGARHQEEIDAALANWRFTLDKAPSLTDPASAVLKLKDIARV
ncbi:16S rRNA (guanine(527)-N(7))-methyltransferase RsmG [Anianabacter salinae]|uniref:16S rRNA (guanine(527)-N(7))-methyltransferase RsmG n=1 Tax=Anianabacter salinae TaxID=2851023 RepID=UPI00225E2A6C|nr:16S rRNA (guanine(527)-N(7))-methyltransferase RsmG [Anianabacter salinae]MBV0913517.1 16S rRNA (guanine(527)-N(7))-methyltransferase RsmG [Anianabacter salinae]